MSKKRFIVLIDTPTADADSQFREWVLSKGAGTWRWISNSWLISNATGNLTAGAIRDEVKRVYRCNTFVIELREDGDTWAGYGPRGENRNMFTWIKRHWKKAHESFPGGR